MYGLEGMTSRYLIAELRKGATPALETRDALRDEVLARLFKMMNEIDDRLIDLEGLVDELVNKE